MVYIILISLAGSLAINAIMFWIAFRRQSDKLTDISYAISFFAIDVISLLYAAKLNAFSWIMFLMVTLWAIRIGGFLLRRVLKVGKDRRFDDMRQSFSRFGKFWLGQALTAWVLMLPVTMALHKGGEVSGLVYLGLFVWAVGLVLETLADNQKFAFKQDPGNQGKWMQQGVWKYARHPNYFGEILVWVGIYLAAFPVLNTVERLVCLASPILITLVLLFVSGVPILERSADKKWGGLSAYKAYKRNTRLLVPIPRFRQHDTK